MLANDKCNRKSDFDGDLDQCLNPGIFKMIFLVSLHLKAILIVLYLGRGMRSVSDLVFEYFKCYFTFYSRFMIFFCVRLHRKHELICSSTRRQSSFVSKSEQEHKLEIALSNKPIIYNMYADICIS